jgi:hypothetical protein
MAHWASQYGVYVLSTANYQDGVAYSSLMEDFPMVLSAASLYDTVSGIQRFHGRHPVTNIPLMVTGYDRYETDVTTHGVAATGSGIAALYGDPITAVSLAAETTNAGIMADINADANHLIYGVWNVAPGEGEDESTLPPSLEDYWRHAEMPNSMKLDVRDFLVARGVDYDQVTTWFQNHPNATPQNVKDRFESFVT